MRGIIVAIASLAVLVSGAARAEVLYGLTDGGDLLRIDPATGAGTLLVSTGLTACEALDLGPDGNFYAVAHSNDLGLIDPSTGVWTLIGDVAGTTRVESLAFQGEVLYASVDPGTPPGATAERLATLDRATAAMTDIGPFGGVITDIDGLAALAGGDLAGTNICNANRFVSVNPATGAATTVASLSTMVIALDFSAGGVLYGATIPSCGGGASNLVRIGLDGSLVTVGPIGHDFVVGLTFAPGPVGVDATSWGRVKAGHR